MPTSTPATGRSFRLALLTTFAAFSALYAPQPLLPFFAQHFDVSPTRVALLITVSLVALAITPLGIGVWLQRYGAQRLLVVATALLGLLQFLFALAPSFSFLLAARIGQSLLYPAIFTAAVTYCSKQGEREAISKRVALYIAATILGGLSGRLIGGYISSWTHWTMTFYFLGTLLLVCSAGLFFTARDASLPDDNKGASWNAIRTIIYDKRFQSGYLTIFLVFFSFVAILNALPFRMVEVDPEVKPSSISLLYLGYMVGVAIAIFIKPIMRAVGGEIKLIFLAVLMFLSAIAMYWIHNIGLMITAGFLMSAGMFTVHATLSGFLNKLKPEATSLVNGLYISIYYSAGAIGSVLPVAVYHAFGWNTFLATLFISCTLSLIPLMMLRQHISQTFVES